MANKKIIGLLSRQKGPTLLILAVWLVGFIVLLLKTVPVAGDGIYYFAYLRSLFIDHDLNFRNELIHFAGQNFFVAKQLASGALTPTGLTHNLYALGPALLWAPFYAIARLFARARGFTDGYSAGELLAPSIATASYGLLGLAFSWAALKRIFTNTKKEQDDNQYDNYRQDDRAGWPAAGVVLAVLLGTNLFYYLFIEASLAHGLGFFAVSGLFYFWLRWRRPAKATGLPDTLNPRVLLWRWLLLGFLAGLVGLIRWQLLAIGPILIGLDLLWDLAGQFKRRQFYAVGRTGLKVVLAAAGTLLAFFPQLWAWRVLYGQWLVIPQGRGFVEPASPHFWQVLASNRHGLLTWTPLVAVALIGLGIVLKKYWRQRWPVALALIFLAQTYINGAVLEWWGGDAFGPRRFTDMGLVFMAGLMPLFIWAGAKKKRTLLAGISVALIIFANLVFMQLFRHDLLPRAAAVTWSQIWHALRLYR